MHVSFHADFGLQELLPEDASKSEAPSVSDIFNK